MKDIQGVGNTDAEKTDKILQRIKSGVAGPPVTPVTSMPNVLPLPSTRTVRRERRVHHQPLRHEQHVTTNQGKGNTMKAVHERSASFRIFLFVFIIIGFTLFLYGVNIFSGYNAEIDHKRKLADVQVMEAETTSKLRIQELKNKLKEKEATQSHPSTPSLSFAVAYDCRTTEMVNTGFASEPTQTFTQSFKAFAAPGFN